MKTYWPRDVAMVIPDAHDLISKGVNIYAAYSQIGIPREIVYKWVKTATDDEKSGKNKTDCDAWLQTLREAWDKCTSHLEITLYGKSRGSATTSDAELQALKYALERRDGKEKIYKAFKIPEMYDDNEDTSTEIVLKLS